MSKLAVTVAVAPYEHALDVLTGRTPVEGVDLNWIRLPDAAIRTRGADLDVTEMSMADYAASRRDGVDDRVAIPVFLDRAFIQPAIWVAQGATIHAAADLATLRLRWATDDATASTYVDAWPGAGGGEAGTREWPLLETTALFKALNAGTVDVAVSRARPPSSLAASIRRALPDGTETAYYEATRIFPIQRVLCVRRDLADRHRWLAGCLFDGFERAKRNSLERLITAGMSRYPIPWINAYVMRTRTIFGDDFWPYGVEANRPTLDAFLGASRHGNARVSLTADQLFDAARP